jgi:phosphoglycolate phosphatase-like HAD superfamily hydrolase
VEVPQHVRGVLPERESGSLRSLKTDTKNKRYTVFVDLDSTLCDTRQRWHLIDAEDREKTDWAAYSRACANDEPFVGNIALVDLLYDAGFNIVILSGRDESAREDTEMWLRAMDVQYDELFLRDESLAEHSGSNAEYKLKRIAAYKAETGAIPVLMIDDWPPVQDALEDAGIPTVLVNPRYGEETSKTDASPENRTTTDNGSATTQVLA